MQNILEDVYIHPSEQSNKLDSYWQDTPHALRDLKEENRKGPQPDNAILVTADVVGLYSNIPQEEGMRVFREALNSRPEFLNIC